MLGTISNMPLRTGGFIISIISNESDNITIATRIPSNSRIMCADCSFENESSLISEQYITKVTNGYFINKDIENAKILRSSVNPSPLSILNGREILYTECKSRVVELKAPVHLRSAVVYKNQVHAFGKNTTEHYKWDGLNWYIASTLPYAANNSKFIVFNNEIHMFSGENSGTVPNHYKWDGKTWTKLASFPNADSRVAIVVYNNELHLIGPYKSTGTTPKTCLHYKYKFNTDSWEQVSTLPFYISSGTTIVCNGKIHAFGGDSVSNHYQWNGESWTKLADLPSLFNINYGNSLIYKDEIHILGGTSSSKTHYKWDGSAWVSMSTLPYAISYSSAYVFDDKINLMCSSATANKTSHYQWDEESWNSNKTANVFNLPLGSRVNGIPCNWNGENIIPEQDSYLIEY